MAFFRKWKTHYKHKKFTSDEIVENEDWGLNKPIKGKSVDDDMKLALKCEEDNIDDNKELFASYKIKYLGCTPIDVKRSEKVTSEAIKTVIANSKAGGRKNKTQKNVTVNVSQNGIEVFDQQAQPQSLMKYSIYKISYCSVDAAHDHTFSFVGSEKDPLVDVEKMFCHVFYCSKRKIAHEITLMVARCFENAYQCWRDTIVQQSKGQGMNLKDTSNILKEANSAVIEPAKEAYQHDSRNEDRKNDQLLIDFAMTSGDMRKYLQNTWVSFDDDGRDSAPITAY